MAKKNLKKMTQVEKLHNEYLELKLKNSTGALKDTHKLSEIRKDTSGNYTFPSRDEFTDYFDQFYYDSMKISEDDKNRVYYYSIFPNMLLSLHPEYVMYHIIFLSLD